jgi:hypothetical protein
MAEEELDAKGLLAELKSLLAGRPKPSGVEPGQAIPYERWMKTQDRANAAETALAAMSTKIEALEKAQTKALDKARTDYAADLGKREAVNSENIQLSEMGFDADGRDSLRSTWNRQPEDKRGASPLEWWNSTLEASHAHQEDAEKNPAPEIPRTLTAYLPQPEKPTEPEPRKGPQVGGVRVGLSPDRDAGQRRGTADASTKISAARSPEDFWKAVADADAT